MFAPITKTLLCLALCLLLFSSMSCPSNACIEYEDVADVYLINNTDSNIDSVIMKANGSITGCGKATRKVIGSKTHHVKFPINVHIQLFSQGDLWKEFFVEMDKNTEVGIYTGFHCSNSFSTSRFLREVELSKENNRFIDSSLTDDYCWLLEKMGKTPSNENLRCAELSVGGKQDLCNSWF